MVPMIPTMAGHPDVARPRGDGAMVPKRRPERQEVAGLAMTVTVQRLDQRKQELAKQHSDLALFCRNDLHEWPNFPIWQSTAVTLRDELTTSAAFNEIGANNRKML